jgi:glyoxylase-like metal-dependent hydrolase (beta-lactamase superfamily II)
MSPANSPANLPANPPPDSPPGSPLDIVTIDTGLNGNDHLAAAFLLWSGDHAAFIDCGTALAVPHMLSALEQHGLAPEQVDYLIATHIHLDHAGGAGALMRHLPNARLIVHPRGSRHLIDPSKLIAGATAVYGAETMAANFGDILPVDPERLDEAADQQVIDLDGRRLRLLDTPGHARHHLCVIDERSRSIFTGDTFGASYRCFDTHQGAFIFPATTPVQFDPPALHQSMDRLIAERPQRWYLTHYGEVGATPKLAADLHRRVDGLVAIAESVGGRQEPGQGRVQRLNQAMQDYLIDELRAHGCTLPSERIIEKMTMDLELNAQGLEVWLQRRDQPPRGAAK